jgi:hypothetical protein
MFLFPILCTDCLSLTRQYTFNPRGAKKKSNTVYVYKLYDGHIKVYSAFISLHETIFLHTPTRLNISQITRVLYLMSQ